MLYLLGFFAFSLGSVAQVDTISPPFTNLNSDTLRTWQGIKYYYTKKIEDCKKAKKGDKLYVRYVGYFEDGSSFDGNWTKASPFNFRLNKLEVIKGWDIIFSILGEGEKARVMIPWKFAYSKEGVPGTIPQKSNLIFDVYLVLIEKSAY